MQRRFLRTLALPVWLLWAVSTLALGQNHVVASIKPLHSLVAGVMQGVGEPYLIVKGGGSPHLYSLKPSDAGALEQADLVFWIGPELESFLTSSLVKLAHGARRIELAQTAQLQTLPTREDDAWASHNHAHAAIDMHFWLDPLNAKTMVASIAAALIEADPAEKTTYANNRDALLVRLDRLHQELDARLQPVREVPYLVFHDGFHYLEHRFSLNAIAAVTPSPEYQPGAGHLRAIRQIIASTQARCIFTEPQFAPKLIDTVIEGSGLKVGVLDALGTGLADGPDLYFELLRRNAQALVDCLS